MAASTSARHRSSGKGGEPDSDLVNAIADAIAAPTPSRRARRPSPGSTRFPHSSSATPRRSEPAGCFPAEAIDDLSAASQSAFRRIRELLRQRGKGRICAAMPWRPASGEHCTDRVQTVLFDAIEFDPSSRRSMYSTILRFRSWIFIRYDRQAAANASHNILR